MFVPHLVIKPFSTVYSGEGIEVFKFHPIPVEIVL